MKVFIGLANIIANNLYQDLGIISRERRFRVIISAGVKPVKKQADMMRNVIKL